VSEGEATYLGVGAGSPGSREATGEGGEGFYISRSGRRADLLASRGGGGKPRPALTYKVVPN
jgi:hypothetical protein